MIVGFTGTRSGMTEDQKDKLARLLVSLKATHLHHGDCIGADKEAYEIANHLGLHTTAHPPSNPALRAYTMSSIHKHPLPYLVRNKNIVTECTVLIAAPKEESEQPSGGTWGTVREARKQSKRRYILTPHGSPPINEP